MSAGSRTPGRSTTARPAAKGARPKARPKSRPTASGDRVQPAPRWVRYSIFGFAGLLGVLVLAYLFPVRTYLEQRHRITVAEQRLRILDDQTRRIDGQRERLEQPSEVIRIARDRFGMVKPGEQPWAVVPGASTTTTTVPGAPATGR